VRPAERAADKFTRVTGRIDDEATRVAGLLGAQAGAAALFEAVGTLGLVAAGRLESEVSDAIRDLAAEHFDVERHWHKRIVRAGPNTLEPYRRNPPDRMIEGDDIVFLDFGPILGEWEGDFGRTVVLGDDPVKRRLCDDLPILFDAGRRHFHRHADITGEELFHHVVGLAEAAGWQWGGTIAGHLVGQFPHDDVAAEETPSNIMPGSTRRLRGSDGNGRECHWILEIHIVDRERQIGGFYEQLLDLGPL
jgi:Xaa-Pro aminopeptidase